MSDASSNKQLMIELNATDDYRRPYWAGLYIIRTGNKKLWKKAINKLFALFDNDRWLHLREDIAHSLGTYCFNDSYVIRSLIERIHVEDDNTIYGLFTALSSGADVAFILNCLNDKDP